MLTAHPPDIQEVKNMDAFHVQVQYNTDDNLSKSMQKKYKNTISA